LFVWIRWLAEGQKIDFKEMALETARNGFTPMRKRSNDLLL
jgi:hypothetical protein